jgi:hypothetical protein
MYTQRKSNDARCPYAGMTNAAPRYQGIELREADAPPNADDTSKTSRSKRYILVLPVTFVEFTSIPRVTNPIPVVIDDTPVLEK